ncbi:hypothetical protein NLJ89_g2936 [Agrocybe chaxingu]|uniref:alpha-1,2-Mannosidase n=1 Tax=Agrocybe chaxingu TaxID=84603 RepID=A0A9W8MXR3_9AGAR|nr:hypothetical protein NLJ89_g2936 [Agrocybe chaxingu]
MSGGKMQNGNGARSDKPTTKKDATPKTGEELPPPIFAKSGILILAVAIAVYMYQTNLFDLRRPKVDVQEPELVVNRTAIKADLPKRDAIVAAFSHAWMGYERDAMGCDEYHPQSKKGSNLTEAGGIGYTVIDAIDTMQLMGLEDEYKRSRDWIATKLDFDKEGNFNTFETTIRVLGGLLSAYHLSDEDPIFLEKAKDLADRLLPAFDTPSGLPLSMVNLKARRGVDNEETPGLISTAEASTLQLELRYLSYLTDNDAYWDSAEAVMRLIKSVTLPSGMAPIFLNATTGQFLLSEIRLGSRGDSFYEYLLKQYLQTGKTEPVYLGLYQETMQAVRNQLVHTGLIQNHTYTAELIPSRLPNGEVTWRLSPKQDHLVCFLAGSLMLGATTTGATGRAVSVPPQPEELNPTAEAEWKLGEELLETCMDTHNTYTGLPPEIAHFWTKEDKAYRRPKKDWYIKGNDWPGVPSYDARYILRPETIESLFIAYRLTANERYREFGWKIFQSIEQYCKVEEGGYSAILNVDSPTTIKMDKMETFFLSETLKYLYLLFSDGDVLPFDKYVFNTEAHPLPIFKPSTRTGFF